MRHALNFLIIFLVSASSLWAGQVRVASWNLNNYLTFDRLVDGVYREDYPKPEEEKEAMRTLLLGVQPDVLLVQEMGTEDFLYELQSDLAALGLHYPYTALLEAADPVRHVAVLSKKPFKKVHKHDDLWFSYFRGKDRVKRGLLELVFQEGSTKWVLYGLHLKSQLTASKDDPHAAKQREREANAIRNRIKRRENPYYLIAGDFNDHPNSPPLRRFLKIADKELSRFIPTADSRGETWTCYYKKEDSYSHLDYILVSPALAPHVVDNRAYLVDKLPESRIASDHRMVVVDLDL